jgi:hypothetical protein
MHGFAPLLAALALAQGAQPAPADAPEPAAAAPAKEPATVAPDAPTRATPATIAPSTPIRRAPPVDPAAERAEAEKVAGRFLEALVARDADALAAGSAERFSFDGDTRTGRDAIRGAWRAILAGRDGQPPPLGNVEVLPAADAVARLGKPPVRVASLARPGVLVALADVGGRPVVLFLAREGGRMAVLGMHD